MKTWHKVLLWVIPLMIAFAITIYQANKYFQGARWIWIADALFAISAVFGLILVVDLLRSKSALPAMRPKITPVRWQKTPYMKSGLVLRNDGEPAFEIVMDEPIQIGKAVLDFWGRTYPQLCKGDPELVIEACIKLEQGSIIDASGLRDLMVKEKLERLPLVVRYRGLDERLWFVTKFDVIREVWEEGLRIGNVHQRGDKPKLAQTP